MTTARTSSSREDQPWATSGRTPRIAIIGAGMSGIAAVVKLRKAGYGDITVFEKADRVGGTWRENTYPGLSCDIPSRWYSFSFAQKADWKYRYSYGPDIQAYMEEVARDFDVLSAVRFNTAVEEVRYEAPFWYLRVDGEEPLQFDVVISATGILHHPRLPDIPGLDTFAGDAFHSARWDHSVELKDKRVGVIGTGSTASQIIGAITPTVKHMSVFQRTPQWMIEMRQKAYSPAWNRLMARLPILQRIAYHVYFNSLVYTYGAATVGNTLLQKIIGWICRRNLKKNVPDPELRAKLTPNYQAACKRLIFCSDFYPAISSPHADLVTDEITAIEPGGVRTRDGKLHELDILVLATGFDATAFMLPVQVYGEDGVNLETQWDGSPRAHRAIAMPQFPNFWMLEGPTGPIGNISLIIVSEHQVDYIISMLDRMRDDGVKAVVPKQSAYEQYNAELSQAVNNTVWVTGGCDSWYFDKSGMVNVYPYLPKRYLSDMHDPQFSEYEWQQ